jgi:hypothetical protein
LAGPRIYDEVVGVYRARYELLAEAAYRFDRDAPAASGDWVGGKEHAGAFRVDHSLHDDREAQPARRNIVGLAIGDGTLVPERCPTFANGIEDRVLARYPEDRVLLTSEARIGKILGRRRRADRDRAGSERAVRIANGVGDPGGNGRRRETHPRGRRRFAGHARGLGCERVRGRRDHEAVGDGKARAPQLAEIRAFAACLRQVRRRQLIE